MGLNLLLILLLAAVVVVARKRTESPHVLTPILYILVALALGTAAVRLGGRRQGTARDRDTAFAFMQSVGHQLGEAIARDVPAGAGILVFHAGFHDDAARRVVETYVRGIEQGVGDRPYTVRAIDPDLEGEDAALLADPGLSPSLLRIELEKHPETDAVVSLMGAPYFDHLPSRNALPPLYVVNEELDDVLNLLLRRGIVRAAVRLRDDADLTARPTPAMSPDEVFALRYRLLRTPE